MKKGLLFAAILVVSPCLWGQESQNFSREDVLSAFKEYNPAAWEKASHNQAYGELVNKVASAYSVPRTEANQTELIALVKNFDNSLRLHALRQSYVEGLMLQAVSGTELSALDASVSNDLISVVQSIFDNTLEVKNIQIKHYKQQIKNIKADRLLSPEQKKQEEQVLRARIKALKAEIKTLKTNAKQKIRDTASAYISEFRADFDAQSQKVLRQNLEVSQSGAQDIKAGHKKPVAE